MTKSSVPVQQLWGCDLAPITLALLFLASVFGFLSCHLIENESWILIKGAINEPQRSELKLVVFLVWNLGLLMPGHGSFCGIILLEISIEMFLIVP